MDMNNVFAGVNWQEVQPATGGREVWEDGWTQCVIADSKGAETSSKNGFGLTLYLKAISGPNNGKTIDDFINVFHKNPQPQEIGQRQFSAYCHAIGEFKPVDNHASNLRNKPFWVRTEVIEEEYVPEGKTEAVKTRKSKVRDYDTNNGTKHKAGNGQAGTNTTNPVASASQTPTPSAPASPSEQPVQAGWGAPPPSAGGEAAPAAAGWGAGNAQAGDAAPAGGNKAPWNS